jgi:3',5'-cyclic AMP phosphodiesterase CpdA
MESIYYHRVIKGYHFIVLGTEDGVTEGTFSVSQIGWLAERLKQANADDPHKPIFVFHHQPIKGTIYGSEWGFSKNRELFYDTLKANPQVISFSGHTHYR